MCECTKDIKIQEYKNQVELTLQKHMKEYWNKETICIDSCLVDEIKMLWDMGIITTGACCAHNESLPYIGVIDYHISNMLDLGYTILTNPNGISNINRRDSFYPKSIEIKPNMVENHFKHLIKHLIEHYESKVVEI